MLKGLGRLKQISSIILIWTLLNLSFNLIIKFGLDCISKSVFSYIGNIDTYVYLLLQTICFAIIFSIFSLKKTNHWIFPITVILTLHIAFVSGLNIVEEQILFQSEFDFLNFQIIQLFWSPFQDISNQFISFTGIFEHEFVRPNNTFLVYFSWILMPTFYFPLLSWLTKKISSKWQQDIIL